MSTFISGITSLYVYEYLDKQYFFFGDLHTQPKEKICNLICDSPNYTFEGTITYDSNCWTITSLLDEWFTYNNLYNIKTDFYMEVPFTKSDYTHFDDLIEEIDDRKDSEQNNVESDLPDFGGWIPYTHAYFAECFTKNKTNCRLAPNIHFHGHR